MENLPVYIGILFALTTFVTVGLFTKASNKPKLTFIILLAWLGIQAAVALTGFYTVTNTVPPRFLLLVMPAMAMIIVLFTTSFGKRYIEGLEARTLTLLHAVRVPVEITLFYLFVHKAVPEIMTFEGWNFDILSGLTAPIVFYFGYVKKKLNSKVLLAWNFLCVALLANIVTIAVLAAPFTFQKLAFEQPNIGVLYFPFIWLPCCVVPLVLLSHLVSIRKILMEKRAPIVAG